MQEAPHAQVENFGQHGHDELILKRRFDLTPLALCLLPFARSITDLEQEARLDPLESSLWALAVLIALYGVYKFFRPGAAVCRASPSGLEIGDSQVPHDIDHWSIDEDVLHVWPARRGVYQQIVLPRIQESEVERLRAWLTARLGQSA